MREMKRDEMHESYQPDDAERAAQQELLRTPVKRLPCYTCVFFEWGEYADDTYSSVWTPPFCMRGLFLPTKKYTCKYHRSEGGAE